MTLTIDVPPQAEAGLTEAARRAGQTPEETMTEAMLRLFGQAETLTDRNGSMPAEDAEGAETLPTVGERLKKYFGIVHGDGTSLAERAEEEYHAALVQRHAEGHI